MTGEERQLLFLVNSIDLRCFDCRQELEWQWKPEVGGLSFFVWPCRRGCTPPPMPPYQGDSSNPLDWFLE